MILRLFFMLAFIATLVPATAQEAADVAAVAEEVEEAVADTISVSQTLVPVTIASPPEAPLAADLGERARHDWISPYALPYSTHVTGGRNWHRMWINTAVLSSAFVGTLLVLECLPEDATSWNRAAIQKTPMFERWYKNIFVHNPEWDHDLVIFNYVLHPYAGAAYFMAARSCGFSFWGSMLYSAAISTVGWEFGIEAFMERPSYQDLFVTPVAGSLLGELFYRGKRAIVERGYELLGSSLLGHIACFFLDPVNEVIDLFRGNPARNYAKRLKMHGGLAFSPRSLSFTLTF